MKRPTNPPGGPLCAFWDVAKKGKGVSLRGSDRVSRDNNSRGNSRKWSFPFLGPHHNSNPSDCNQIAATSCGATMRHKQKQPRIPRIKAQIALIFLCQIWIPFKNQKFVLLFVEFVAVFALSVQGKSHI